MNADARRCPVNPLSLDWERVGVRVTARIRGPQKTTADARQRKSGQAVKPRRSAVLCQPQGHREGRRGERGENRLRTLSSRPRVFYTREVVQHCVTESPLMSIISYYVPGIPESPLMSIISYYVPGIPVGHYSRVWLLASALLSALVLFVFLRFDFWLLTFAF